MPTTVVGEPSWLKVSQALSWQVPPAGCPAALSDVLIAGKLHVSKFNYICAYCM
jgi:hypothetical protein